MKRTLAWFSAAQSCSTVALLALLAGCSAPSTDGQAPYHRAALQAQAPGGGTAGAKATDDIVSTPDALVIAAVADLRAGRLDAAQAKINQALARRLDRSYYHFLNGLSYHIEAKKGDQAAFELAKQGYDQAIHFDPSNWLAYYFRGRLQIDQSAYGGALSDLAQAILLRPDDPDVLASFAYAAYRSHRPDLAAGALAQMEKTGQPVPASVWRNSALVMAAIGNRSEAQRYLDRYRAAGASERDVLYVSQRIADWSVVPRDTQLTPLVYNPSTDAVRPISVDTTTSIYGSGYPGASPGAASPGNGTLSHLTAEDMKTAKGTEDRMVVIDVVMISTEDTIATSKGVNLMNGLQLEFGGQLGGVAEPALNFVSATGSAEYAGSSIIRAISVPAVNYNLNILNANNQHSEVLSRPSLVGLAGKESEFFSGNEIDAVAVAGSSSSSASSAINIGGTAININKEIGVRLAVVPTVLEDGRLKLGVSVDRTFLETPSTDVNFTFKLETSKDQIKVNVIMNYGETLILGGLSEKEVQNSRDGVPGLQDVPVLQYLFSKDDRSDYQKSLLILLTPRPPQYIYQPDKSRQSYESSLSDEERPIANLQARYSDWFKPYPNWASVFHHLQDNDLYREFRTGDVDLESWSAMQSLQDRLTQALDFLHY